MTISEYMKIVTSIYENGRVVSADDGDDAESFKAEFRFEAAKQYFSPDEIEEALKQFN